MGWNAPTDILIVGSRYYIRAGRYLYRLVSRYVSVKFFRCGASGMPGGYRFDMYGIEYIS